MSNRRALWPVVTAVLIGLPVLYIAGYGPAWWRCNHVFQRDGIFTKDPLVSALVEIYAPVVWLEANGPEPIRIALEWYAGPFGDDEAAAPFR